MHCTELHCTELPAGFGDDMPFNYFTYGAACSEVELDTLTGDFQALRTHICMDVGSSVNPAIDIGQVEGGFIQVRSPLLFSHPVPSCHPPFWPCMPLTHADYAVHV